MDDCKDSEAWELCPPLLHLFEHIIDVSASSEW